MLSKEALDGRSNLNDLCFIGVVIIRGRLLYHQSNGHTLYIEAPGKIGGPTYTVRKVLEDYGYIHLLHHLTP